MSAYSGLYHTDQWYRQTILSLHLKSIKSTPSTLYQDYSPLFLGGPQE